MSASNSDALRRRWEDPAYRERQIEANRRQAQDRRALFTSPLARKTHGHAVRVGWRVRTAGRRDDG